MIYIIISMAALWVLVVWFIIWVVGRAKKHTARIDALFQAALRNPGNQTELKDK